MWRWARNNFGLWSPSFWDRCYLKPASSPEAWLWDWLVRVHRREAMLSTQGLAAACEPHLQTGKTRHLWALWETKLYTDISLFQNESLNGKFRGRCCPGKVKSGPSRHFGRCLSNSMIAETQLHYSSQLTLQDVSRISLPLQTPQTNGKYSNNIPVNP